MEADHGHRHGPLRLALAVHLLQRHRHLHIGGQVFRDDDNVPLGYVDLSEALTESSDTYFYSLGGTFWQQYDSGHVMKGPDPLQTVASQYGFGHYTGIACPVRTPGSSLTRRLSPRNTLSTRRTTPTACGSRASRSKKPSVKVKIPSRPYSWRTPTRPLPMAGPSMCPRSRWRWKGPGALTRKTGKYSSDFSPRSKTT